MQRITTATRVVNKHGPGRDGFGDGNPTTGTPSTQLEANWFDQAQEEIARVIELAGMTLDPADLEQLHKAILFHVGASGAFVRRAGDIMTGNLTVDTGRIFSRNAGNSPAVILHDIGTLSAAAGIILAANNDFIIANVDAAGGFLSTRMVVGPGGNIFTPSSIGAGTEVTAATVSAGAIGAGGINITGHLNGNTAGFSTSVYGELVNANTISAAGQITAQSIVCSGGAFALGDASLGMYEAGGQRYFQWQSGWGWWFDGYTTTLLRGAGVGSPHSQFVGNNDFILYSPFGVKDGGGPWTDRSDARIKNVVGNYTQGLAAILQLQPKRFTFRGNDRERVFLDRGPKSRSSSRQDSDSVPQLYVGLIAQDCEGVMPEMVFLEDGEIDGQPVDDMRLLDTGPVTWALVNAVKELAARLDALDGGRTGITLPA